MSQVTVTIAGDDDEWSETDLKLYVMGLASAVRETGLRIEYVIEQPEATK